MDHGATGPWPVAQPCRFDPVSSSERPGTCPPAMHRSGRRREAGPERNRRHGPALSGRQRRLRHERAHAPGRRPAGTVVSGCRHGHRRLARHRPEGLPLPAVVHPDGHRRAQFRLRAADRRPSHPALLRLHELPGRLPDDHGRHRRRQTAGQKRCRVGAHGRLRDHGSRAGQRRGAPALARPVRLLVHRLTGSPAHRLTGSPAQIDAAQQAVGIPLAQTQQAPGGQYDVAHAAQVAAYGVDDVQHVLYFASSTVADYAADLPRLVTASGERP
ncbi:hypothetical protein FsymDg_4397 [Candidatus Protofrankia datiscae]|uniref:Uncharacterized protein n=1 Tax=Candidatus Protofrankia datiscae TaxID=2716812 RepID=F8AZC1_9ACTN|nr:hypothetical protein FsymDg_4397 [Candidatus Protofrankia datiscae]